MLAREPGIVISRQAPDPGTDPPTEKQRTERRRAHPDELRPGRGTPAGRIHEPRRDESERRDDDPDRALASARSALDAFTSDAVPVHLLTTEAARLYREKLKDDGVIIFNISNRYLDLAPVLGAVAPTAGMTAFLQEFEAPIGDPTANDSSWVVMVPPGAAEARIRADGRWTPIQPPAGLRPWTDGYSNLLSAIMW